MNLSQFGAFPQNYCTLLLYREVMHLFFTIPFVYMSQLSTHIICVICCNDYISHVCVDIGKGYYNQKVGHMWLVLIYL